MKIKNLLLPSIILISILASCAMMPQASSLSKGAAEDRVSSAFEMPAAPEMMAESAPMEGIAAQDSDFSTGAQPTERIVIRNASLSIVVEDPVDSVKTISDMSETMGGFVVSSNVYKTTTSSGLEVPNANITVRVPAEKLDEALTQIKALVEDPKIDIQNEEVSGQDVTSEVTDLESRLRNLKAAEEQLLQIMNNATDSEDVIAIFRELTDVRGQIEVIEGQLKYYNESARYSAISVFLQAKAAIEPITIGGWKPGVEAQRALQALVEGGKYLANALIWLVLFAVPILAIIGLPIYLIVRVIRKRQIKKEAEEQKPTK
jgi:hypothetical protein